MHEAYEVIPIVKKLPSGLSIETICAYNDFLLVGTKSGTLLYYHVVPCPHGKASSLRNSNYEVKLLHSNKSFSKKIISQIEVIPEFQILVCLADNNIAIFDLSQNMLVPLTPPAKTKGAHLFATNVLKYTTSSGEGRNLCLCVAIKKKLQLYTWSAKDTKFVQLSSQPDLVLQDVPRKIVWCLDSLCVGFKSEYCILKTSGDVNDLFPTGSKQHEPLILNLPDEKFAVGSDEQTILINHDGHPTLRYSIKWTKVPLDVVYDDPYLIAVLPSSVEVRAIAPRIHIQNIDLQDVRIIAASKKGWVFVASASDVWLLHSVSYPEQIAKLREQSEFELALYLAKKCQQANIEKQIENLHAFSLFRKQQFNEAMEIFLKLDTDPSHVIGLFPNLMPEDFRSELEYPDQLPDLMGTELENGLLALTAYLVEVRRQLTKDIESNSTSSMSAIVKGGNTTRSKKELLQIIDTTLLKCYLQTNDALVASLLRMKDNYCHIEESQNVLRKHRKYNELIILYNKKGMHHKALQLLKDEAKKPKSPLMGHERTVLYLQQLGKENLPLIFKYSEWVLKEHPEDGLKIFTEECMDTESLPRNEIYSFLCTNEPDLTIPYLEHIIHVWKDRSNIFHNSLIWKYCEKIKRLMSEYVNCLPEAQPVAPLGQEPGELGQLRLKLLNFLETSQDYTLETFPMHLLHEGLYEEAAVVLGKLGHHEKALDIYIHVLQDVDKAEEYCSKQYAKGKPGDKDVYYLLLKLYLSSTDNFKFDISSNGLFNLSQHQPNLDMALNILSKYSTQIDPFKAINVMPKDVCVAKMKLFLQSVLHKIQAEKHDLKLVKSLLSAENLQVQMERISYQSYKLFITELDICRVCQKRIGKSAFVRFPTGEIVHYSCKDQFSCSS